MNLPIYLLFAAIPFWHLKPFAYISAYEIVVIINLPFLLHSIGKAGKRWNGMDTLVFLFAFYGVFAVLISGSLFYESMRTYRYIVLGPTLLYLIIRMQNLDQKQLAKSMVFFSTVVAVQSLVVIYYSIAHHARPVGYEWETYRYAGIVASIVTFAVLAVMASSASLLLAWRTKGIKRYALLLLGLICTAGLLASATRAAEFVFFLLFPLSGWFLRRTIRRKLLVMSAYLVLAGVGVAIAFMYFSSPYIASNYGSDNSRAIERVIDIEEYKADILGRVAFWTNLVREASSSAILGKGLANFDIGLRGGTSFSISSAHNVLVSTFYTSGLIGLVIILLLWRAAFCGIYQLNFDVPDEKWRARFLTTSIMVMLLVSITNDLSAGRGNLLMLLLALLNYQPVTQAQTASIKVPSNHNSQEPATIGGHK